VKLTEELEESRTRREAERQRFAALEQEYQALLKERSVARDQIEERLAQYATLQAAQTGLLRQLKTLEKEHAAVADQLAQARQLLTQQESKRDALSQSLRAKEQELGTLQSSRSLLLKQVGELEDRLSASVTAEREMAKDLELVRAGHKEDGHLQEQLEEAQQRLGHLTADLAAQQSYTAQLKELLSKREEVLQRQAEQLQQFQVQQGSLQSEGEAPTQVEALGASGRLLGEPFTAPIFAVTESLGFVVLDVHGIEWATVGTRMLVEVGNAPPLAMEIGERDTSGLAVAQILGKWPESFPLKVGEVASIRQLRQP
jgi:chromosome segregation ATPase